MVGAGKTTLAHSLSRETGALRLSPDDWIKAIVGDDRVSADRHRDRIERLQWRVARRLLRSGVDVIVENGFWRRHERLAAARDARRTGARVTLCFLSVPLDVLLERVAERNRAPDHSSFQVRQDEVIRWFEWFEPLQATEALHYDQVVRISERPR